MKLYPIGEEVLVRLDPREKTFGDSALVRPDIAQERPMWGRVMARGEGGFTRRGLRRPMMVQAGDRVCVPWRTGRDVKIGGEDCVFVRERDLLLVEGGES